MGSAVGGENALFDVYVVERLVSACSRVCHESLEMAGLEGALVFSLQMKE